MVSQTLIAISSLSAETITTASSLTSAYTSTLHTLHSSCSLVRRKRDCYNSATNCVRVVPLTIRHHLTIVNGTAGSIDIAEQATIGHGVHKKEHAEHWQTSMTSVTVPVTMRKEAQRPSCVEMYKIKTKHQPAMMPTCRKRAERARSRVAGKIA